MMTLKEQEDKVFEEIVKVKSEMETIVGFKVTKTNYKKAIIEMTKRAANKGDVLSQLSIDSQEKIQNFFSVCQQFLGEVIWQSITDKNIKICISYKDKPLTAWNIPIDVFCSKEEAYQLSVAMMAKSLSDCFSAYFMSPALRQAVIDGDEVAVKALYHSFSRPSMQSSLNNLIMLKENFPDFYQHITTKLDVMTVENMEEFINNKNEPRKSNKARQGKKKTVSRIKKF
jgi:hypothetical protein